MDMKWMENKTLENENEYRIRVQSVFEWIEKIFEQIDPDIAECEYSQGALTLLFADDSRCILSAQPSVHQIWLALASRGTAYHFNFDGLSQSWMDDKGKGIELLQFLESVFQEQTGQLIQFRWVTVYTMENCPYCMQAKKLLSQRGILFKEILVPLSDETQWDELYQRSGMRTMPQIFFQERLVGGYQELKLCDQKDQLQSLKSL